MKRPLKNKRVFGPFINRSTDNSVSRVDATDNDTSNQGGNNEVDPIIQQAENWFESISDESNKRKMMKNYFKSMTDLSDNEIDRKLNEAGL